MSITNQELILRDRIKSGDNSAITELFVLRMSVCPVKMVRFPFNEKGITVSKTKIPAYSFITENYLEIKEPASYVLQKPNSDSIKEYEEKDENGEDSNILNEILWDQITSKTTRIEIGTKATPTFLQSFTENDPALKMIYKVVHININLFTFWGCEDLAPQVSVVDVADTKQEGDFKISGVVSIIYF